MISGWNSGVLIKCLIFLLFVTTVIVNASPQSSRRNRKNKDRNKSPRYKTRDPDNEDDDYPFLPNYYENHNLNPTVPKKKKVVSQSQPKSPPRQQQQIDPCHLNYHRIINEPRRSYNYRFGSGGNREHALCDRDLVPGWYKFHSLAGDVMPTSCPGVNYCGTRAPVWMKGTIPSVEEGITKSTACVSVQGKCCTTQIPILVKNCTEYVVYHLQPTPACPSAYCAGYEVPCPSGLASDTGYTPCHFPVDLLETKVSYGLSKDKSQLQFFCDVTLGGQVVPETVGLQVEWLADDEVVQSETFGLLQQHKGVLKEDKWQIGQTLQCRARAKHTTINTFTAPQISKPINTGIVILSDSTQKAVEGSEPALVEFQTTIPIVCPKKEKPKKKKKKKGSKKAKEEEEEEKKEEPPPEECCLVFDIVMTPQTSSSSPRCASGGSFDLAVTSGCSYKICADEWNATHRVPVWAVNDGLFGGEVDQDPDSRPSVLVDIRTTEGSPPRWHDLILPTQEVQIIPADVVESCTSNSQYQRTFDGIQYENPFEGTFIFYKHEYLPYEVQIYRKECTHSKLCNCGVAVRFGDVMIASDVCSTGKMRFWSYTYDGSYIEPAKIIHLPQILRLDDGRSFQFQFPTGTRVLLGPNLRVISIQASSSDLEHTTGLCGSFDRDPTNDFSTYKGQIVCPSVHNKTNSCPDFAKSWRLLTEQSLFVGSFTNDGHTEEDETNLEENAAPGSCSCVGGAKKKQEAELKPKSKSGYNSPYDDYQGEQEQPEEEAEATTAKCSSIQCIDSRGNEITTNFVDLLAEEDFLYEGDEFGTKSYNAALQPVFYGESKLSLMTTKSNASTEITDDAAEVYCRGMIEGMEFTKLCRDLANIDIEFHIKKCQGEVKYTKSTAWTFDTLEELRMECRYQIYHNVTTWEPQLGRQHGSPPLGILSSLCLNNCTNQGNCEHGVCRCQKGFAGADCSVNLSVPPKVNGIGFKNTCDIREKACSDVLVWGERFAESDSIRCHFDVYSIQTAKSVPTLTNSVTTNGKLFTFQAVICDIPELPVHEAKTASFYIPGEGLEKTRSLMRLRVSYGGLTTASEPLDYIIYDSLCWNCETPLHCEARPTQSCNVLQDPFGSGHSNNDPFQTVPAFSNLALINDDGRDSDSGPRSLLQDRDSSLSGFQRGSHHPAFTRDVIHPVIVNRGITTRNKNKDVDDDDNPCTLPRDTGPCRGDQLRYFYDAGGLQRCRPFIYGGCQGNRNNFLTEADCVDSCVHQGRGKSDNSSLSSSSSSSGGHQASSPPSISLVGPASFSLPSRKGTGTTKYTLRPEQCLLGNSPGTCKSEVVRYYFDTIMGKCRPFIYSGCKGNENNFETKEKCIKVCGYD